MVSQGRGEGEITSSQGLLAIQGRFHRGNVNLNAAWGTSLVVQWLRFQDPNAGELSSIPGQGTRSDRPQQRQRIPSAATKTQAVK